MKNQPFSFDIYSKKIHKNMSFFLNQLPNQDQELIQAIKYSCLNGGKHVRGTLVYLIAELFQVTSSNVDKIAISVELMHTYSLIHDDLPAMDDDDIRRGQPSNHIKFNQATAILAGDALQALSFEILTQLTIKPHYIIRLIELLSNSVGTKGMCLGQSLDILNEHKTVDLNTLKKIHQLKTGALFKSSILMGAIVSGDESKKYLNSLSHFGETIGLFFQVQDDILDITSTTDELGKPQGSDQKIYKSTFPSLLGLDEAIVYANELQEKCLFIINQLPGNKEKLIHLIKILSKRKK